MNWADGYEAYRVWRCAWQGVALKPNLLIEAYSDKLTLIFNKFGDKNVAYYRIYGGTTSQPTNVLATTPLTMANLRDLQNQTKLLLSRDRGRPRRDGKCLLRRAECLCEIIRPGRTWWSMATSPRNQLMDLDQQRDR